MINAAMCFLTVDRKTLFLYRNKGAEDIHNKWYVPPGGRTERGERGIDCIMREFEEETGLKLINPKLKVIATFYNQGRILGGRENPEDWLVEVYVANEYNGKLKGEHSKAKPIWISELNLPDLRMYPGDRRIFDLCKQEGLFEVLVQYAKEELIRFEYAKTR